MTGLDTNVLLRVLVADDHDQSDRASRLLRKLRTKGETAYISVPVLCETAWVLSESYGFSKPEVLQAFSALLEADVFQVEDEDAVKEAITLSRTSPAGFVDHLIGSRNLRAGCDSTVTFDRKLRASAFSAL